MIKMSDQGNGIIKGFTLIEGLIALALVSILVVVGFTLNSFINNSVTIGDRQANLQFYPRLAKAIIENRVKYASSIIILNDVPTTDDISGTRKAIYVNGDGAIVEKNSAGTVTPLLSQLPENIDMSLSFRKISEDDIENMGDNLLGFTITSSFSGDTYQLESSILNLSTANLDDGAASGVAILYEPAD